MLGFSCNDPQSFGLESTKAVVYRRSRCSEELRKVKYSQEGSQTPVEYKP